MTKISFKFIPFHLNDCLKKLKKEVDLYEGELPNDFNWRKVATFILKEEYDSVSKKDKKKLYRFIGEIAQQEPLKAKIVITYLKQEYSKTYYKHLRAAFIYNPKNVDMAKFMLEMIESDKVMLEDEWLYLKDLSSVMARQIGIDNFVVQSSAGYNNFFQWLESLNLNQSYPLAKYLLPSWFENLDTARWVSLAENQFSVLDTIEEIEEKASAVENCVSFVKTTGFGYGNREALLSTISEFGEIPEKQTGRWSYFSKTCFETMQQWVVELNIDRFFMDLNGDPDRLQFWKSIAQFGIVSHTKIYKDVKGSAFHIVINGYHFVEFGIVGNALYIYRSEKFRYLSEKYHFKKSLKDKYECFDRVNHTSRWQVKTKDLIEQLIGRRL